MLQPLDGYPIDRLVGGNAISPLPFRIVGKPGEHPDMGSPLHQTFGEAGRIGGDAGCLGGIVEREERDPFCAHDEFLSAITAT